MTERVLFSTDYFSLERDSRGIEFVRSGDEVLVVPMSGAGEVLLAVEPSPAFGDSTLVLPGGSVEENEAHEDTANRELQEEIGYKAGHFDYLGELRPFSKYLTVRSFLYLAHDLVISRLKGDENYPIGIESVPLGDLASRIQNGRLRDARTIAGLYLARDFLSAPKPRATL